MRIEINENVLIAARDLERLKQKHIGFVKLRLSRDYKELSYRDLKNLK